MVMNCFLGGPRKSSLSLCSRIQTTAPMIMKNMPVVIHISRLNGFRNAHGFELLFVTGTTTTSPDSMYG